MAGELFCMAIGLFCLACATDCRRRITRLEKILIVNQIKEEMRQNEDLEKRINDGKLEHT